MADFNVNDYRKVLVGRANPYSRDMQTTAEVIQSMPNNAAKLPLMLALGRQTAQANDYDQQQAEMIAEQEKASAEYQRFKDDRTYNLDASEKMSVQGYRQQQMMGEALKNAKELYDAGDEGGAVQILNSAGMPVKTFKPTPTGFQAQVHGGAWFNVTPKGPQIWDASQNAWRAPSADEIKVSLAKAPERDTIQRGTEKVTQEFRPEKGGYVDVARGPMWGQSGNIYIGGNGTTGAGDDIDAWADAIVRGNATLETVPARGPIRTQVVSRIAQKYPEADLAKIKANKKFTESATAANTLSLVEATRGIIDDMNKAYQKLGRTNIPAINYVQDKTQEAFGNADRSEFLTIKNYGVQEVERMLTGSGAMSDHRVKLAFESLSNASTPEQFDRAVQGVQKVMDERARAVQQGPYAETGVKKTQASGGAPPQAVEYLRNNPQFKEHFRAKYGYLPEGY